ncbi:unnamed protein product [Clonostachys rosea f. rosea IK726]|uniref:Uncharacterized protein n=1 Tax=Clonostachys rosea f. rosea IK726 TaxID=1349383 RepID=A0ACA9U6A1_BIOOC|nr:unnamed protein product [Clonostachys rosea f. rosea IK726]
MVVAGEDMEALRELERKVMALSASAGTCLPDGARSGAEASSRQIASRDRCWIFDRAACRNARQVLGLQKATNI